MRIGEVNTGRVAISTPAIGFTGHSMSSMRCGVFEMAPCVPLAPKFAVDNYICHVMPGTALLKLHVSGFYFGSMSPTGDYCRGMGHVWGSNCGLNVLLIKLMHEYCQMTLQNHFNTSVYVSLYYYFFCLLIQNSVPQLVKT